MAVITGINAEVQSIAITTDNQIALEFTGKQGNSKTLFVSPHCAANLLLLLISYIKSAEFKHLLDQELNASQQIH